MLKLSQVRKLNTNRNSRIFIYITSHGGDGFIKFRGKNVVLSEDLNRTLIEMYQKGRYKEIVFVLDTCEAYTLYTSVDTEQAPNIMFIASSIKDQKATSINYDPDFMTPLADRFSYLLFNSIEQLNNFSNFDIEITSIFNKMQYDPLLKSKIAINNTIRRRVLFKDYFGNINFYRNNYYKPKNMIADKSSIFSGLSSETQVTYKLSSLLKSNSELLNVVYKYQTDSTSRKIVLIEKDHLLKDEMKHKERISTFFFNASLFVVTILCAFYSFK